ncbi:MAG: hypothetical protein FWG14_09095 [Peptococcaceae bacterium]|nr:hypothetical protein [Peptococcaceae bacterium]
MTFIDIMQLFIPVITFAMGYFLTSIGYKRDRKLSIIREKFDRLYHPFLVLVNELGMDNEFGFAIDSENADVLKPILEHLTKNAYLTTAEGQKLIWETRYLFVSSVPEEAANKEKEEQFAKSIGALFEYLIQEYMKSAKILGYELIGMGTIADSVEPHHSK